MMLKHLTKYIKNYVVCKKCNLPELVLHVEGKKDLKSKCNSCGSTNSHDGSHKAGKVIIADIQKRGEMRKDITKKKDDDLSDPEIETPD